MSEQLYRQVPNVDPYQIRQPHPDAFWSNKYGWLEPVINWMESEWQLQGRLRIGDTDE